MRNIKKKLQVKVYLCTVYNRETKQEYLAELEEIENKFKLDNPNIVILDKTLIEEKESTFVLSGEDFLKYAIEE